MIFYFMDYGIYSWFGEIMKFYEVNVWIVGVIIEDLGFLLLEIFVWCILINIKFLVFEKCFVNEKVDLVKIMIVYEVNCM